MWLVNPAQAPFITDMQHQGCPIIQHPVFNTVALRGQDEEQILTGLALAGVLTGQLAGASLR